MVIVLEPFFWHTHTHTHTHNNVVESLLLDHTKFQSIYARPRKDINGILTVCDSVRRNTKPEVDSAGRSLRDRCIDRGMFTCNGEIYAIL